MERNTLSAVGGMRVIEAMKKFHVFGTGVFTDVDGN